MNTTHFLYQHFENIDSYYTKLTEENRKYFTLSKNNKYPVKEGEPDLITYDELINTIPPNTNEKTEEEKKVEGVIDKKEGDKSEEEKKEEEKKSELDMHKKEEEHKIEGDNNKKEEEKQIESEKDKDNVVEEITSYYGLGYYNDRDLHDIADDTPREEEINNYIYEQNYGIDKDYDDRDIDI